MSVFIRGKLGIVIGVIAFIMFFISASTTIAVKWIVYEANVPPDDTKLGDNVWEITEGSEENMKIENGVLHADTTKDNGAPFRMVRYPANLSKATIEARLKVVQVAGQTGWAAYFGLHDPKTVAYVLCEDTQLQVYAAGCGGWQPCPQEVDMTEYHVVRLTKDGDDFKVYFDGEKKPLWEGQGEAGETDKPTVTLGDGTGTAGADSYWDYVAYTTDGAFLPDVSVVFAVESKGKLTTTWAAIKR